MIVALTVVLAVLGAVSFDHVRWRRSRRDVEHSFPRMATSIGPVPYLDIGPRDGPPALVATGGGSGIDFLHSLDWLVEAGHRVLAISRPGYYGVPIDAAPELADHADLYAEVIRALGIGRVHVLGISAGGPSALHYAARHPTCSLTLWCAVTGAYRPDEAALKSPLGRLVLSRFGQSMISWMLSRAARWMPRATMTTFLRTESRLDPDAIRELVDDELASPARRRRFSAFVDSTTPMTELYAGMMHEMERMGRDWSPDWAAIAAPTLAIASCVDADVPPTHDQRIEHNLVAARVVRVRAGGHFVWWGAEGRRVIATTLAHLAAAHLAEH